MTLACGRVETLCHLLTERVPQTVRQTFFQFHCFKERKKTELLSYILTSIIVSLHPLLSFSGPSLWSWNTTLDRKPFWFQIIWISVTHFEQFNLEISNEVKSCCSWSVQHSNAVILETTLVVHEYIQFGCNTGRSTVKYWHPWLTFLCRTGQEELTLVLWFDSPSFVKPMVTHLIRV